MISYIFLKEYNPEIEDRDWFNKFKSFLLICYIHQNEGHKIVTN